MKFTIKGDAIHDIPSFYEEINRVFMHSEDWKIGNSLDALNDLLYGGYGAAKDIAAFDLIWLQMEKSRQSLGVETTRAYYEEKLLSGSPFNKSLFKAKLAALSNGVGDTYFDMILEIIAEHPHIRLVAG